MLQDEERRLDAVRRSLDSARARLVPGDTVLVVKSRSSRPVEVVGLDRRRASADGAVEDGVEVREASGSLSWVPLRRVVPANALAGINGGVRVGHSVLVRGSVLGRNELGIVRAVEPGRRRSVEVEVYNPGLADGTLVRVRTEDAVTLRSDEQQP